MAKVFVVNKIDEKQASFIKGQIKQGKDAYEVSEKFRTKFEYYPLLIDEAEEAERLEDLKQNSKDKLFITSE